MPTPTQTTTQQIESINDTPTDWLLPLGFQQFDPSLGTLQGIDVGLTADVAGSVSITSLEAAPSTATASFTSDDAVSSPTGVALASVETTASDGWTNLAANGATTTLALAATGTSDTDWPQGSIDLGAFTGTGQVPLTVSNTTRLDVSGPANMDVSSQASAGATVSLQYTYQPANGSGSGSGGDFSGVWMMAGMQAFTFEPIYQASVTTTPQTFSFADSTTGWTNSVPIAQFNPALGTLEAVNLTLSGDILASVTAQNLDAASTDIDTTQTATVSLGSDLTVAPSVDDSMWLAAGQSQYDQNLTQADSNNVSLYDPSDLAAFSGQGTMTLPISATGTSTLDGPGNMTAELLAQAGATVTVSYTYLPTGATPDAVVWTNTNGGVWSNDNNWDYGWDTSTPQASDDVAITQPGTYTVTLDAPETIHSLLMDSPDATLVLDAPLTATTDIILDAGTIVFDGGSLSADTIAINQGRIAGSVVDISVTGSLTIENHTTITPLDGLPIIDGPLPIIEPIVAAPPTSFPVVPAVPVSGPTPVPPMQPLFGSGHGALASSPQGDASSVFSQPAPAFLHGSGIVPTSPETPGNSALIAAPDILQDAIAALPVPTFSQGDLLPSPVVVPAGNSDPITPPGKAPPGANWGSDNPAVGPGFHPFLGLTSG
jgi:hypothetical protein